MLAKFTAVAATTLLLAACASDGKDGMAKQNMAHVHMGHVTTGWKDTPEKKGLLPTAIAEAKIVQTHVGLALKKPDDLAWMKTHTAHIQHAVDPSLVANGPGLGYGVVKATAGTAQHIKFAAESDGASDNVKLHAKHVQASAANVRKWAGEISAISKDVMASASASDAVAMLRQIDRLATQLTDGTDANGDGKVTWVEGEGGLGQAETHMGLMKKGEGKS
jgi:hypothetical protein